MLSEKNVTTDKKLTVTAVITTHNRQALLERAVKSVLEQTYPLLDLVVVDDASSDNTQEYLTALAAADERVTYIRISPEETKGANHARNVGIKAAGGVFVAFLDDDDVWLPNKTSEQVAFFERHPDAGAVSSDWYDVYCFGNREYRFKKGYSFKRGKNEFFITPYLSVTSGIMVRKAVLDKIGGFDEQLPSMQEYELSIRITLAFKTGFIKKCLFEYYHYENQKSISNSAGKHIAARELIDQKYEKQHLQFTPEQKKRYRAFIEKDIAYRYLMSGDKKAYRKRIKPYLDQYGIKEKSVYYLSYIFGFDTFIKIKLIMKNVSEKIR